MRDMPLYLRIGAITLFAIILVIMVYPFLFMVFAGMKDNVTLAINPLGPPNPPNFDNIRAVWIEGDFLIYFKNSLIVSLISVLGTVVMCASAAYVFARGKLGASKWLFGIILLGMMVPGQVALIPGFWLMGRIGLLNTLWSVIFVHLSWTPFGIFVLRTYFLTIPDDLADAGRIDGCNEFGLFWRIYAPLAGPALVTVAIFAFIWSWNDFLWPLVLVRDPNLFTIQQGVLRFADQFTSNYSMRSAGLMFAIFPPLIFYLAFRKGIQSGLTAGAVKM